MSGETEVHPSGWTPDTLKVLEDEKIEALQRLIEAQIRRLDENIDAVREGIVQQTHTTQLAQDKFEATVQRDSVKQNEFRGALDDVNQLKVDRREMEAVTARIDDLAKQVGDLRSRLDVGPAAIPGLQAYQNQQAGRHEGVNSSVGFLVSAVAVSASIIGVVVVLANVLTK